MTFKQFIRYSSKTFRHFIKYSIKTFKHFIIIRYSIRTFKHLMNYSIKTFKQFIKYSIKTFKQTFNILRRLPSGRVSWFKVVFISSHDFNYYILINVMQLTKVT